MLNHRTMKKMGFCVLILGIMACAGSHIPDETFQKRSIKTIDIYYSDQSPNPVFDDLSKYVKIALEEKGYEAFITKFPHQKETWVEDLYKSIQPRPNTDGTLIFFAQIDQITIAKFGQGWEEVKVDECIQFQYWLWDNRTQKRILSWNPSEHKFKCSRGYVTSLRTLPRGVQFEVVDENNNKYIYTFDEKTGKFILKGDRELKQEIERSKQFFQEAIKQSLGNLPALP